MGSRNLLALTTILFLISPLLGSSASAQAGSACSGTICGLGGQIRLQFGDGLPFPISVAPAQGGFGLLATNGPFTAITIRTVPRGKFRNAGTLPFVGQGLGQTGQIKPAPSGTIMQTTAPGTGPRGLTLAPGAFTFAGQPQGSIAVVNFAVTVFAVQSNLSFSMPHPGTTKLGAAAVTQQGGGPIPTGTMANKFFAGGRVGAATVSFYADATANGTVGTNFGATGAPTPMAGEVGTPPINGVARFHATGNQFGGQAIGRTIGTKKIYFNGASLDPPVDLPCKVTATPLEGTTAQGTFVPFNARTDCQFSLSIVDLTGSDATAGVDGGAFNGLVTHPAFTTATGVFTGTIGYNGTIHGTGAPVTAVGANIPFAREASWTIGLPLTTGKLSITVTGLLGQQSTEMFVRTGTDARDAAGNGVVALVSGSLTARDISAGNANRQWITLEIPEPSAIFAASAGLLALFGCHRLARPRY